MNKPKLDREIHKILVKIDVNEIMFEGFGYSIDDTIFYLESIIAHCKENIDAIKKNIPEAGEDI